MNYRKQGNDYLKGLDNLIMFILKYLDGKKDESDSIYVYLEIGDSNYSYFLCTAFHTVNTCILNVSKNIISPM